MIKTILMTGATDGIGLVTAERFITAGHRVIIHGRSQEKLERVFTQLTSLQKGHVDTIQADLSDLHQVEKMASDITEHYEYLDVIINNAGVLKTSNPINRDKLDIRFVVNTLAPYLLTMRLMPLLNSQSRVINLSSAAQETVELAALRGEKQLKQDFQAYAQSKLAITMWTRYMAEKSEANSPIYIAVNPGSLLGSKMVKEGFGVVGKDLTIGADILIRAALASDFAEASGLYFDNDIGRFAEPHADGMNESKIDALMTEIHQLLGLN